LTTGAGSVWSGIQGGEPESLGGNARAASTVRRNAMEWVGETGKYIGLDLQVFGLRRADVDPPHRPPCHPRTSHAE
jgi:hypothetical protein